MGIKCPLQDMFNFKSVLFAASIVAATLAVTFSSPVLAGSCDSVKEFAQEIEQISGKPTTVECYEQEPTPAQVPSREGAEVFLSMAALLAGSWGLVAILNMNKTQVKDWDYSFSSVEPISTINSSPSIWWEDESPIQWEDLDISTIEWNDLDISDLSDIQWNDEEDLSSIIWWEDLI